MTSRLIAAVFLSVNILLAVALFMPSPALAASGCDNSHDSGFLGFPTWYKYLTVKSENGNCNIELPKEENDNSKTDIGVSASKILLAVFEIILRIGGLAAVSFVVYGGIQYVLSQGDPERTAGARKTIINALVGMAIAISAVAIVNLIGNNIAK